MDLERNNYLKSIMASVGADHWNDQCQAILDVAPYDDPYKELRQPKRRYNVGGSTPAPQGHVSIGSYRFKSKNQHKSKR